MATNRCEKCGWFSKWEDLEEKIFTDATNQGPWEDCIWGYEEGEKYYIHKKLCKTSLGSTNAYPHAKNFKRPRCPECKHGSPYGHKGRACPQMMVYTDFEGITDAEMCGCTYRDKEQEIWKKRRKKAYE